MKHPWEEQDNQVLTPRRRGGTIRKIYSDPYDNDMEAMKAMIAHANLQTSHIEEGSVRQSEFDYQLSQFIRLYVAHKESV